MTFINKIAQFKNDEDGAVTVDWVVLTAALVGLGIAVLSTVATGVDNVNTDLSASFTSGQTFSSQGDTVTATTID
ncbi:MAG: pilus assembly protein [Pseudoruegeria sp.]